MDFAAAGMWVNCVPVWENGGLASNCFADLEPLSLHSLRGLRGRGLMVLPLQVAFLFAAACLRKREMMGGPAI